MVTAIAKLLVEHGTVLAATVQALKHLASAAAAPDQWREDKMRSFVVGMIIFLVFLPKNSFADPKDDWLAFTKKQAAERDEFLKKHPDVAAYVEEQRKAGQEQFAKYIENMKAQQQSSVANP